MKNDLKKYLESQGYEVVKTWLNTEPRMQGKYRNRVQKVKDINDKNCVPVV